MDRLLDALDYVKMVGQDELHGRFLSLDVSLSDSNKQVPTWYDVTSVLQRLEKVNYLSAALLLLDEVVLQVLQLIECHHFFGRIQECLVC